MKLAATSTFTEGCDSIENFVTAMWMRSCPTSNALPIKKGEIDKDSLWFLDFIDALIFLTSSMKSIFRKTGKLIKILHVVSNMLKAENTDLSLSLIDLVCTISLQEIHDENKHIVQRNLVQIFKMFLQSSDELVKTTFFNAVKNYLIMKQFISAVNEDYPFKEIWDPYLTDAGFKANVTEDWKIQLKSAMDLKYCHKCVPSDSQTSMPKSSGKNFDLADIDSLFETESDSEPACKKIKLNPTDIEERIERLETASAMLCKAKERIDSQDLKIRIREVCETLLKIIE